MMDKKVHLKKDGMRIPASAKTGLYNQFVDEAGEMFTKENAKYAREYLEKY